MRPAESNVRDRKIFVKMPYCTAHRIRVRTAYRKKTRSVIVMRTCVERYGYPCDPTTNNRRDVKLQEKTDPHQPQNRLVVPPGRCPNGRCFDFGHWFFALFFRTETQRHEVPEVAVQGNIASFQDDCASGRQLSAICPLRFFWVAVMPHCVLCFLCAFA